MAYILRQMINLLAAVDAVADPEPQARYVVRVRGEQIDTPPKSSTKLANRARRWMVDEAWLRDPTNHPYDVEARIAESGTAWGDAEEPEVLAEKRKRIKEEKQDIAVKKKRRLAEASVKKVEKKSKAKKKSKKGKGREKAKEVVSSSSSDDLDLSN